MVQFLVLTHARVCSVEEGRERGREKDVPNFSLSTSRIMPVWGEKVTTAMWIPSRPASRMRDEKKGRICEQSSEAFPAH